MDSTLPAPLNAIPTELRALPQWVCWRYEWREGKKTKPPISPITGGYASSTDSGTWASLDIAARYSQEHSLDGVGFVFTKDDPYCGIDIDGCIGDGGIAPDALDIVSGLKSYTEYSPSKKGLHIIIRAGLGAGRRTALGAGHIEIYDRGRYFTITGHLFPGTSRKIEDRQGELDEILGKISLWAMPIPLERPLGGPESRVNRPVDLEDQAIIDMGLREATGKFRRLYLHGDTNEHGGDWSRADEALCWKIAFYTKDPTQIDRIFRGSALMRPKWDEPHYATGETYGEHAVAEALARVTESFVPAGRWPSLTLGIATKMNLSNLSQPLPVGLGIRDKFIESSFRLIRASELLAAPATERRYVVNGLFTVGGLSLVAAKPKVGKSTLVRNIAVSVARGEDFLGRETERGTVCYLAFEEDIDEVVRHLRQLGVGDREDLYIFAGPAPPDFLKELLSIVAEYHPSLIIIDPVFRAIHVNDTSSYAEMTAALDPLLRVSRATGAHIMTTHHLGKAEREDSSDQVLGSVAITGVQDYVLEIRRRYETRVIRTGMKRVGDTIEDMVLRLDPESGAVTGAGPLEGVLIRERAQKITELLQGESMPEAEIIEAIGGKRELTIRAVRQLLQDGVIVREKEGRRFMYSLS